MVINQSFWKNRRVFITGHTGFKGGWLSLWLKMMGAELCGYSLAPTSTPNLFDVTRVNSKMNSIIGDIRDQKSLVAAIQNFQPEIVIHLAAQSLVKTSYDDPTTTYDTNVMGTLNLLEAVRKTKSIQSVVIVTSDKCYENQEWCWPYRENEPLGGHDPYSSSKACVEILTSSYRRCYFSQNDSTVGLATVRAGNVIAGGDWANDRLIPDLIRSFQNNSIANIRFPNAVRPWQHVLEPLSGYLLLAEKMTDDKTLAQAWNFGPNNSDSRPVKWIADFMVKNWGDEAGWKTDEQTHPHEAHLLNLDSSKALNKLEWTAKLNLETALKMTVSWYKAFLENQNMNKFTLNQIQEFVTYRKS